SPRRSEPAAAETRLPPLPLQQFPARWRRSSVAVASTSPYRIPRTPECAAPGQYWFLAPGWTPAAALWVSRCCLRLPYRSDPEMLNPSPASPFLHGAGELLDWQRVQHVSRCQPRPPRLQHSKPDLVHVRCMMRIRVDHDLHSAIPRHPQVPVR